jgi:hypothetical protein
MKKLILVFIVLLSLGVHSQTVARKITNKSKKYDRIDLITCKPDAMGCSTKVRVGGEEITLDTASLDPNRLKLLNRLADTGIAGRTMNSYGTIVSEKGHMPNPMAEQKVFKYVYKNNADLNICKFRNDTLSIVGCTDSIVLNSNQKDISARADFSEVEITKADYTNKKAFVVGYFISSRGYMPNPMVYQHIFKVTAVSFTSLKEVMKIDDSSRGNNKAEGSIQKVKSIEYKSKSSNSIKQ